MQSGKRAYDIIFWKQSIEGKINDFYGGKTVIYKIAPKKPYKSTKKMNIVKTTLLLKAIHRFNAIAFKKTNKKQITIAFCTELEQRLIKLCGGKIKMLEWKFVELTSPHKHIKHTSTCGIILMEN